VLVPQRDGRASDSSGRQVLVAAAEGQLDARGEGGARGVAA